MARHEIEREDLLREATALVERTELRIDPSQAPVVFGFRRDGSASAYFGSDPVFQFNTKGELRRAYWQGRLVKAEQGRLVALVRQRLANEVQLLRHPLSADEAAVLLQLAHDRLSALRHGLIAGHYSIVGQVPSGADVVGRVIRWLESNRDTPQIALRPNVF